MALTHVEKTNDILEHEHAWIRDLQDAVRSSGASVPNKFLLACWAIQAKGNTMLAMKRINDYADVKRKYRLDEISSEDATAWMQKKHPEYYYCCGQDKDGRVCMGARKAKFDKSKMQTEDDWRYLQKNIEMNLLCNLPTLWDAREGVAYSVDAKGTSMFHFDRETEKRRKELTTCLPAKVKAIYLINPPVFLPMLVMAARLFVKAKIINRLKSCSPEQFLQNFSPAQVPPDLGGARPDDFFEFRDATLKRYHQTVLEFA